MNQLLSTKFFIPTARSDLVSRPRLLKQLNDGLNRKLTLISAPAGFGKTTLVSEWIAGPWHRPPGQECERPVAWLSLDKEDSDPKRFLTYLVAALKNILDEVGEDVLGMLQTTPSPPTEAILTALLNEIAIIPGDFCLVLDDYHVLDAKPIDQALTFLLDHQPPQMHLVITTREDPNLPLAKFRARGRINRDTRCGFAFYTARSRWISQPDDGSEAIRREHRRTGNSHRGMDCGVAISRNINAGS